MQAAFKMKKEIKIKNIPSPEPGLGQIKIRISHCGVCGTDIHIDPDESDFHPFGHEIAGTVIAIGEGVVNPSIGDHIVLDSATPCGYCSFCKNAEQELCSNIQSFYFLDSFGFAEEMIAPAISAIPYTGISPQEALMQEPLGVAIDLVRVSDIEPGNNVLILGQGPIGLMAVKLAKTAGAAKVFVTDFSKRDARMKMAMEMGADKFIPIEDGGISSFEFSSPIHRILVTSPPSTIPAVIDTATKGAIISFIGIGYNEAKMCNFDANQFHFKKLQLRSSFASPALYGPKAISLIESGTIPVKDLITHEFQLSEIDEAIETARSSSKSIKVIISM